MGLSVEGVRSNIVEKQYGECSGNVQENVQNKPNQQENGGDKNHKLKRNLERERHRIPMYEPTHH